ncbi:hypothetical protein PPERSA_09442 [Pseudocohnilembus persalinus]|uniref:Uncharacterized protein n=1 Tax=Pseudocohnilembus persalinus TaxID=266149 RepID=A0A0V0Q9P3_PSEPJ|nr:hypothetical protein PPERSA_09442 [Pseudocohnilembus persalinus]|eukprot:KRW98917.1 hypothetical protein PPERSA_09442 [Pseudocohnilembus persalinus]
MTKYLTEWGPLLKFSINKTYNQPILEFNIFGNQEQQKQDEQSSQFQNSNDYSQQLSAQQKNNSYFQKIRKKNNQTENRLVDSMLQDEIYMNEQKQRQKKFFLKNLININRQKDKDMELFIKNNKNIIQQHEIKFKLQKNKFNEDLINLNQNTDECYKSIPNSHNLDSSDKLNLNLQMESARSLFYNFDQVERSVEREKSISILGQQYNKNIQQPDFNLDTDFYTEGDELKNQIQGLHSAKQSQDNLIHNNNFQHIENQNIYYQEQKQNGKQAQQQKQKEKNEICFKNTKQLIPWNVQLYLAIIEFIKHKLIVKLIIN